MDQAEWVLPAGTCLVVAYKSMLLREGRPLLGLARVLRPDHAKCMQTLALNAGIVIKMSYRAVQVEQALLAAGGNPAALAAARNHLGNHYADRRQWAQVIHADPHGVPVILARGAQQWN